MDVGLHGGGAGRLHALGAMVHPGLYYEHGLLHPFVDYGEPPPLSSGAETGPGVYLDAPVALRGV